MVFLVPPLSGRVDDNDEHGWTWTAVCHRSLRYARRRVRLCLGAPMVAGRGEKLLGAASAVAPHRKQPHRAWRWRGHERHFYPATYIGRKWLTINGKGLLSPRQAATSSVELPSMPPMIPEARSVGMNRRVLKALISVKQPSDFQSASRCDGKSRASIRLLPLTSAS